MAKAGKEKSGPGGKKSDPKKPEKLEARFGCVGRKKGAKNKKTIEKEEALREAREKLIAAATGAVEGLIALAAETKDDGVKERIWFGVLDRTIGRPKQAVALSGKVDSDVKVEKKLTPDEIKTTR